MDELIKAAKKLLRQLKEAQRIDEGYYNAIEYVCEEAAGLKKAIRDAKRKSTPPGGAGGEG